MKHIPAKRWIILAMTIFILPLMGLLLWYNLYNVNTLNERIAKTNQNTLEVLTLSFDQDLKDIESYMANFLANDTDSIQMRYSQSTLRAHVLSDQVLAKYRTVMGAKNVMAAVFFHSESNELTRGTYNHNYSYEIKAAIELFITQALKDPENYLGHWVYRQMGDAPFLFYFLQNKGVYHVSVVDVDYVTIPQNFNQAGGKEMLYFVDSEGTPVTAIQELGLVDLSPHPFDEFYAIQGNGEKTYFLVQTEVQEYGLALQYATLYHGILLNMDVVQIAVLAGSAVLVLLILFSYWFLAKFFLRPFDSLVSTMEQVRGGRLDAKLETASFIDEFMRLQNTFNAMMDEIKTLKIASYEEHLERQQVELQYLQIQIRPHFFLNCLKNLYALAQEEKYRQIQEMILRLSEHLRFLFRETDALVPIAVELKNVENYIALQQIVLHDPPMFSVQMDQRLRSIEVPPLSFLTFVENSVKHGMIPGKTLEIHLALTLLEDTDDSYISVVIRDNGRGFSPESLKVMQRGLWDGENEHVGIQNVCKRFRLLYGDTCTFFFSNRGGAETEIFFPYHKKDSERSELE